MQMVHPSLYIVTKWTLYRLESIPGKKKKGKGYLVKLALIGKSTKIDQHSTFPSKGAGIFVDDQCFFVSPERFFLHSLSTVGNTLTVTCTPTLLTLSFIATHPY